MTELRAADLAFTADEANRFLNDAMGLHLSFGQVQALESRTEGWIAGLCLAALTLRDQDLTQQQDFITALSGTHRYILDYLAGEVFDRQEPEVQCFLLYTSILGGLTGSLCEAVLGEPSTGTSTVDGQSMLERLENDIMYLVPLDGTRTWYRYHHLFAGFLRERLRRSRPDLIPELHLRAARWLEETGRLSYAAEHALAAAHAFSQAASLAQSRETLALALIAQGRLLQTQVLQGRLQLAAATYEQALSVAKSHNLEETPAIGVSQIYMAEMLREWNDLDAAEDLVRQGIARCRAWVGLAEMALDVGDRGAALYHHGHGAQPSQEHLRQARRPQPDPGDRTRPHIESALMGGAEPSAVRGISCSPIPYGTCVCACHAVAWSAEKVVRIPQRASKGVRHGTAQYLNEPTDPVGR